MEFLCVQCIYHTKYYGVLCIVFMSLTLGYLGIFSCAMGTVYLIRIETALVIVCMLVCVHMHINSALLTL